MDRGIKVSHAPRRRIIPGFGADRPEKDGQFKGESIQGSELDAGLASVRSGPGQTLTEREVTAGRERVERMTGLLIHREKRACKALMR